MPASGHSRFLSTPSARRATDLRYFYCGEYGISIHALREEGDYTTTPSLSQAWIFLSTPSARRATDLLDRQCKHLLNFYPRPPRGGRPGKRTLQEVAQYIFLSTPSARRATVSSILKLFGGSTFLSTPSARRATRSAHRSVCRRRNFYPRPPRGGRPGFVLLDMIACYFYPRPPRGGRPVFPNAELYLLLFLSTPSARRATRRTTRSRTPAGRFLSTPSARRATC